MFVKISLSLLIIESQYAKGEPGFDHHSQNENPYLRGEPRVY